MAGTKLLSAPDYNGLKGINAADGTAATDLATKGQMDTGDTNAKSRANHTGTQLASTVSDFDTQVRTSRLDQLAAPTGSVNLNSQKITTIGVATLDTDAAQWGQIKDLLSGLRKTDVRIVMTTNDTLSGLAARDGITPIAGDRALATAQTTASANGIYVAAAGAWARAVDADVAGEFATQWLVTVREGTVNADTLWQHNTDGAITLGTTSLVFNKIGPISATTSGFTTTSPSISAGGTWTVTHNLNTKWVTAQVARVASPYDFVDVRVERTTVNTVSVLPDVAMASGEYEIMVGKVA